MTKWFAPYANAAPRKTHSQILATTTGEVVYFDTTSGFQSYIQTRHNHYLGLAEPVVVHLHGTGGATAYYF